MQTATFEEVLDKLIATDRRYQRDAYGFMRDAIRFTQKALAKKGRASDDHVSGEELLAGIRDYAIEQFGPMARDVLREWGVSRCADFGEIVFNLADHGLIRKTETDTREHFERGYDFEEAFCHPFLPTCKQSPGRPVRKPI